MWVGFLFKLCYFAGVSYQKMQSLMIQNETYEMLFKYWSHGEMEDSVMQGIYIMCGLIWDNKKNTPIFFFPVVELYFIKHN